MTDWVVEVAGLEVLLDRPRQGPMVHVVDGAHSSHGAVVVVVVGYFAALL